MPAAQAPPALVSPRRQLLWASHYPRRLPAAVSTGDRLGGEWGLGAWHSSEPGSVAAVETGGVQSVWDILWRRSSRSLLGMSSATAYCWD